MTKFFEWRDEWSCGVEIIDRQHRQLAETFNKIVEIYLNTDKQADSAQRSKQLHSQLNIFYEQVREHFNDEEGLMCKANYPGQTDHAREHLMLVAELKRDIRYIEEEPETINIDALCSLKTWFISHILGSDKEFSNFLHSHSLDEVTSKLSDS